VRQQQVLVVENEQIVALDLEVCLETMGYTVSFATTGEDATEAVERLKPDIVLMDIRLDGSIDGIEAAGRIRKDSDTPLIFLTAYADQQTIERAAHVDPSGYIVKPFNEKELAASIHLALHRRRNPRRVSNGDGHEQEREELAASTIRVGDVRIDLVRHRVFLRDTEIQLTKKEFGVLRCLAERAGEPVSPEAILERVWGPQFAHYLQTLRVHVGHLRQKLEANSSSGLRIEGVRGVGYRLVENPGLVSVNGF
jgi:DNA-binding response OmpR family regulator